MQRSQRASRCVRAMTFLAVATFCLCTTVLANADTVAGNTSLLSYGACLGGAYCGDQGLAVGFTAGANFDLTSIDVYVDKGALNSATVKLVNAATVSLPGTTVLESWSISGLPSYPSTTATTVTSTGGVHLISGTEYFIEVIPPSGGDVAMYWMVAGYGYPHADYSGGTWNSISANAYAFSVFGTPTKPVGTPEPASLLLLASGLGFVARRRRK